LASKRKPLDGKVAVVTGSAQGLGRTMAMALLDAGARVTFTDIEGDALAATAHEARRIGGNDTIHTVVANVAKPADAQRIVGSTIRRFGSLHILVNNAGIGASWGNRLALIKPPKVWEIDPKLWDRTLSVNASGPFLMIRAALPEMRRRKWGRIVGITTSLDNMLRPGQTAYGASKAAHEALMAMLAKDLEGTGVTANVLVPGGPANTRMVPAVKGWTDRGKLIQPEQMVAPLLYICSEAADKVNGHRFVAAAWNPRSSAAANAKKDNAPIGWTGQKALMPH
jgi:NAD(P)-dependent dehydrogenase (short-subunit alcohol dehydrogenase family)